MLVFMQNLSLYHYHHRWVSALIKQFHLIVYLYNHDLLN